MILEHHVNHQVAVDLDSAEAFEGPEKLLEVWFAPNAESLQGTNKSLRNVSTAQWEKLLDIVQCKVLSSVHTSMLDAFVLSESSMFAFPHKLVLKTCGTTTLLVGIPKMLEIARTIAGFGKNATPYRVFYSHKTFNCPEKQAPPHKSWKDEVSYLDSQFDNGKAYLVGDITSEQHWYCYVTGHDDHEEVAAHKDHVISSHDETMEILMTDLLPSRAQQFFTDRLPGDANNAGFQHKQELLVGVEHVVKAETDSATSSDSEGNAPACAGTCKADPGHVLGAYVSTQSGIADIYPRNKASVAVDSFCFTPCGYSANAIVDSGYYYTIHVTPEQHCSYASFETNVPAKEYGMSNIDVIEKVLNVFRPGKLSVTLFEAENNSLQDCHQFARHLDGYKRTDKVLYEFDGYQMVYVCFEAIKGRK
ncbi:S-adenosylmethionine decarboxylase proenzyme [Yarrowia sp. B02]|nr:S-adenosylmethionine decarboxylase proenzyme [Yarrowia sp. B02]